MKNLEQYIKDNRDQMELEVPNPENWSNIEAALNKKKSRRLWVYWSAAASLVIIAGVLVLLPNYMPMTSSNKIINKGSDSQYASESLEIIENPEQFSKLRYVEPIEPNNQEITKVEKITMVQESERESDLTTETKIDSKEDQLAEAETYIALVDSSPNFIMDSVTVAYTLDSRYEFETTVGMADKTLYGYSSNGSYDLQGTVDGAKAGTWSVSSQGIGLAIVENESYFAMDEKVRKSNKGADVLFEYDENLKGEDYNSIKENDFKVVLSEPVSTFSIDVDGASYTNVRRHINDGSMPPKDAVRIEELINYFQYDLPEPKDDIPFSITTELGDCPWNKKHKLVQISLKGKSIEKAQLPKNNLVFLIDVSGSMSSGDKLDLLKKGFRMLTNELREEDRVSIVVYAGAAGLVLEPTAGNDKPKIMEALDRLEAGGSTAGGEGIELAYKTALENFSKKGNNRIILATDGDFNVGMSDQDELIELIEEKRKSGIFLSVLGFGTGNIQDGTMEQIADNGNGNYNYIDNVLEAKKVLVTEMGGTLQTIAKDVKLQLEFNPLVVSSYRLIGYENRLLAREDFDDDTKDAGELGSGHTITALYELVPTGTEGSLNQSELKYTVPTPTYDTTYSNEVLTVKFRYKPPKEDKSKLIQAVVKNNPKSSPSLNYTMATSVAEFGMLLRDSKYKGESSYSHALELANKAKGEDKNGYRSEYIRMVEKAKLISGKE